MEVPRLRVQSELQLMVYATATATQDLSYVCDLHHSSWQHQILSLLHKARDQTLNLMVTSWICFCCATTGTPYLVKLFFFFFFGLWLLDKCARRVFPPAIC